MNQLMISLIIFIITLIAFGTATKYVSITVIALISMMAMVLSGSLDAQVALGGFGNSSAILMASIFVVSAGLNKTSMISKISSAISNASKGSFRKVIAGYVILTAVLAQFIPSAVAVFSIVFPMAISVCKEMDVSPSKIMYPIGVTAIGTVITLPFSSSISEMARIQGFLEAYEYTEFNMGIMDIAYAKFPTTIAIILMAIFILPKFTPEVKSEALSSFEKSSSKEEKKLSTFHEVIGFGTFVLVLLGLVFSSQLGLATWQVTMIGALIIAASSLLDTKEVISSMNLNMVLLYIGCLGIASALSNTGAADLIGSYLSSIIINLNNNYVAGLLLFLVPFILTQFMLNLGVYSIFTPLYIMMCKSMGANPIGPIMLCMIASMTAFFTPLATPAVPLMMGVGNYSIKDLLKMGLLPLIVITVIAVGWIMTVYPIF